MRVFIDDGEIRKPLDQMTYPQTRQASAIMECIGRMIPQEGIDYDVDIFFKVDYDPDLSMNIVPHTDKGEWWKRYVMEMLSKYPPEVDAPPFYVPLPYVEEKKEANETKEGENNEKIVS